MTLLPVQRAKNYFIFSIVLSHHATARPAGGEIIFIFSLSSRITLLRGQREKNYLIFSIVLSHHAIARPAGGEIILIFPLSSRMTLLASPAGTLSLVRLLRGGFVVVVDRFVAIAIGLLRNRNQKDVELTHLRMDQPVHTLGQ